MDDRSPLRQAVVLAAPFLALALLVKIPSLFFPHAENDEVIYWTVAQHVAAGGGYTLRGAPFLDKLPPSIYDHPLFHHPPLYVALLVPFVKLHVPRAAVIVSWAGHFLAILAVALLGLRLKNELGDDGPARRALAIPLLGVALDPVLTHVGRKLWIDALLAGSCAMAIALAVAAAGADTLRPRRKLFAGSGIAIGLAGLAKLPGLLASPVVAFAALTRRAPWRDRVIDLATAALPALILVVPWFVVFYRTYGTLFPSWTTPDAAMLARFPLMASAVAQPWWFFVAKLPTVAPVFVVGVALFALAAARERPSATAWTAALWLAAFFVAFTWTGATRYSFQMRYLAPLCPALYLLPIATRAWYAPETAKRVRTIVAVAVAWGAIAAIPSLISDRPDELLGPLELLGWIRF